LHGISFQKLFIQVSLKLRKDNKQWTFQFQQKLSISTIPADNFPKFSMVVRFRFHLLSSLKGVQRYQTMDLLNSAIIFSQSNYFRLFLLILRSILFCKSLFNSSWRCKVTDNGLTKLSHNLQTVQSLQNISLNFDG